MRPGETVDDAELRPARRLYYLGVALIGLLSLRAAGQVTFADLLFLLSISLAAAELAILRRRIPVRLPMLLLIGMTIFTIGGLLSTFQSYDAFKSVAVIVRLVFITVFWFWLGTVVLSRHAHVRKAVALWVGSVAACGAAAVLQTVFGEGVVFWNELRWQRASGLTEHPNDLGGMCAIALVPALMLAVRPVAATRARVVSYAFVLAIVAGVILSGSIGGLSAALAALLVWLTFQTGTRQTRIAYSAIAVCCAAAIGVQAMTGADTPLDRLDIVTGSQTTAGGGVSVGSVDSRIQTYRVAVDEISDHPLIGVGLDLVSVTRPFGVVSYEYEPHNLVIGTWYKAGLIGLLGVLVMLVAVYAAGWSTFRRAQSDEERMLAIALTCGVVAFAVFSMGAPVLYSRYGWIPAALLLALRAVQLRSAQAGAAAQLPALAALRLAPAPRS